MQGKISVGNEDFDKILHGGLIKDRVYLIQGGPGTGKTTLGLEFLLDGLENHNNSVLYITLAENKDEIIANAKNFNWEDDKLDSITFLDMTPTEADISSEESYDIFSPAEVEKDSHISSITEMVNEHSPARIVVDSITQLKMLCGDQYDYRKQLMSLVNYLSRSSATSFLISEHINSNKDRDLDAPFLTHGIINLSKDLSDKNIKRRYLEVDKFRGSDYLSGKHEYIIDKNGFNIYPRVKVKETNIEETEKSLKKSIISSGIPSIDQMLHGGLDRNTVSIITGQAGIGKTTLGFNFIKESLNRNQKCLIYMFNESIPVLTSKLEGINIPINDLMKKDNLIIKEVNPIEITADRFVSQVRKDVEEYNSDLVMLDSLNSFLFSVDDKSSSRRYLYNLTNFLRQNNITSIFIHEISKISGDYSLTEFGTSYIVDSIILMRYIEYRSKIKRTIGIFKKRMSSHERTLREFKITSYGIEVGSPLTNMQGVLSGKPEFISREESGEEKNNGEREY